MIQRMKSKASNLSSLQSTLTPQQNALLEREISILKNLLDHLNELRASQSDIDFLQRSLNQLEDLFLLVVVGEFNSGKSSFLNALLGKRYLKEGVTPTTSKVGLLKYGQKEASVATSSSLETLQLPVKWLKEISMVDTPGTNAIMRDHQEITEEFVPRSDLVLFVTSADRAFSESERQFLENIKQWRKKVIVVISKRDMVESEQDLEEITQFVVKNFESSLGMQPTAVFAVSAKEALRAKLEAGKGSSDLVDSPLWKKSHFDELERYILETLDHEERTKLKLENPIGVAEHLLSKYKESIEVRAELLKGDLEMLINIKGQMEEYKKEMIRDFEYQKDRIDNILSKMKEKSDAFMEEKVAITQIFDLIRSDKLRTAFEKDVVGDTSHDIEKQIDALIDWMISKSDRLWKSVMTEFQQMARLSNITSSKKDILGKINVLAFDYNRSNLLASIGSNSLNVVKLFDREKESLKLSTEVRQALVNTAAIEVGVGIGTLLAASLLDLSGIIGVGVMAATGLAVLPYKRSTLKKAMEVKITDIRKKLKETMERHFQEELEISLRKVDEAIEPYSRFVNIEQERIARVTESLKKIEQELADVKEKLQLSFHK